MNDKTAEEIQFHSETISTDANAPLQLIREKELEISGRVLGAKREADEIVAEARKKAAEVIAQADAHGGEMAAAKEKEILAQADIDAAAIREDAEKRAAELARSIEQKKDAAVAIVLETVTTV